MKRRVALATCEQFPLLSDDDRLAVPELEKLGIEAVPAIWTRPRDWSAFDAVVIRSTWYYWLEHERFLRWLCELADRGVQVHNPVPVIRENVDKRYLEKLRRTGFPVVPTAWLEPGGDLPRLMDERGWPQAVIKPVVSGNAEHTHRIDRSRAAEAAGLLEASWAIGPAMVQPFLASITAEGEYSLLFFNGRFSHAVIKEAARGDYRVQHEHGGTHRPTNVPADWIGLAQMAQAQAGERLLYARVDLALYEGRPFLMELELTEPYLYFEDAPESPARFARALAERL